MAIRVPTAIPPAGAVRFAAADIPAAPAGGLASRDLAAAWPRQGSSMAAGSNAALARHRARLLTVAISQKPPGS